MVKAQWLVGETVAHQETDHRVVLPLQLGVSYQFENGTLKPNMS